MTAVKNKQSDDKPVDPSERIIGSRAPTKLERVRDLILPPDKKAELRQALPRHIKPEVFERNFFNALMQSTELMVFAEHDPALLFREVAKCAALGLLLDPQLGEAYIFMVWNSKANRPEPQFRIGYRGMIKLARQSGLVTNIYAREVYTKDKFNVRMGIDETIEHEPNLSDDRGELIRAYAVIKFRDGSYDFVWMSRPDWHKIRDRSEGWKAFKNGKIKSTPWATDEGEMAKKTVLRRLLKTQPQSPEELRQVLAQEDETEFVEERVAPVSPIRERLAGAIGQGDGMQHDVGDDVEAALKAARAVTMIDDEQEPAPQPHHAVAVGSGRPPSPVSQPSAATTSESEPDSSAARDEGKESPPKQSVTDSVRGSRDAQGNGPPSASHIPELAAAFEAGREARRKNFKKRAVPPEYRERGRSAEAAAWMQGWEAEDGAKSGGA